MPLAIKVENLSKAYRLGEIGTGTISNDFKRWIANARGKEDPFLKIGEVNDRTIKSKSDVVWSLKDINFEIEEGNAVGIIGRNGAGKSTLLKLLSRITSPTSGEVSVKGRIASLLEVGTGFHPDLSGRENIFLNGAILGMRKKEIKRKFDEIVDFSGVERYIDTPVKRYSSGMYVRLAFAVAAHLEPEILIIDEVLAVGDAEFQKKCLGKMKDVSVNEGRTVLFVSHNMQAMASLCTECAYLENGRLVKMGKTTNIIKEYLSSNKSLIETSYWNGQEGDENGTLLKTWVKSLDDRGAFHTAAEIEIGIRVEIKKPIEGLILGFRIFSESEGELAYILYDDNEEGEVPTIQPGFLEKRFILPGNLLSNGKYSIKFAFGIHNVKIIVLDTAGTLNFQLENISGVGRRFINDSKEFSSLFRPQIKII